MGASAVVIQSMVDPATLESCAWREAFAMAKDLHLTKVFIALDCQEVLKEINHEGFTRGDYSMIIREVQHMASEFICVHLQKCT